MSKHLLQIDGRTIIMEVHDCPDEIVCNLARLTEVPNSLHAGWSPAQYEHVYAWFNAIIQDLRASSDKCIHLFDRQHVMTT